jgi:peptide/nickel transport system permease protein
VRSSRGRGFWADSWRRFRKNRAALLSLVALVALYALAGLGPTVYRRNPYSVNPAVRLQAPSASHLLGTDDVGRDVLARIMHGGRVSMFIGVVAMGIALLIGVLIGSASGYFEGRIDAVLMRLTDAFLSLPVFFFLLSVVTLFGGGVRTVVLTIGLTSWMRSARLVRGQFLQWKPQEFILAARSLGARDSRVMFHHLLPQTMPLLLVDATLGVAYAILTESSLSFLGLGVVPPTPTWGNMLNNAQSFIWETPLLAVWPGVLIFLTVLSINSVGDGLRDALDPRLR